MFKFDLFIYLCNIVLQIEKGKLHGCIDVGFSVMAIKKKAKCIDLDAEENIYHLKVNRTANQSTAFPQAQRMWKIKKTDLFLYLTERHCYAACDVLPLTRPWFLVVGSSLQVKSEELFDEWVSKLRHHRLYRQNISTNPTEKSFCFPHYPSPNSPSVVDAALIRRVRSTPITHSNGK